MAKKKTRSFEELERKLKQMKAGSSGEKKVLKAIHDLENFDDGLGEYS